MMLHLIRHGMTAANEQRLYCGATDLPLSDNGIAELMRIKAENLMPQADTYIATGLKRTAQTLQVLFDREPDLLLPQFNEFNFGDFELRSYDELKTRADYIHWIENYDTAHCPNGESKQDFDLRTQQALDKLLASQHDSVVLVCHGGVIAAVMERFFPKQKNFYEWQPKCGRGYSAQVLGSVVVFVGDI